MKQGTNIRSIACVALMLGLCFASTCYADPEPETTGSAGVVSKPTLPVIPPQKVSTTSDITVSSPSEQKTAEDSKLGPIRIVFSTNDIETSARHCLNATDGMTQERPDFKGGMLKCPEQGNKNGSNAVTIPNGDIIKKNILPVINAVIQSGPFMYNLKSPLRVPEEIQRRCANFNVSSNDFKGVENADVVAYVAAGPMGEIEADKFAWATPCASIDGRTVAIGLNLNPSKIHETEKIIMAAAEEIQKVLGIYECSKEPSVLLSSTTNDGQASTVCVNMKCDGNKTKQTIFYRDNAIWTECYGGNAVMSADSEDENTAKCPPVADICDKPKFNSHLRSLSPKLKPMRILASLIDLNDPKKYCPDNKISKVPRTTFRDLTVNCLRAVNNDFSETLTNEKRDKLTKVIIPQLLASFEKSPLLLPHEGMLKIPFFERKSTCTRFSVPLNDHTVGFNDTDLVLYVAAGPMQQLERNVTVWAEACANMYGRTVAIAMNFNPARIVNSNTTLLEAKKALSKVLGTRNCQSDNSVVLKSGSSDLTMLNSCANVKCEADKRVLVQRRTMDPWHECQEGEVLDMKFDKGMRNMFPPILCPKYEEVCSNDEEKVKPISKIIGEFTALQQTERYVLRPNPQFRSALNDGVENIMPLSFAAVIAAVLMVL